MKMPLVIGDLKIRRHTECCAEALFCGVPVIVSGQAGDAPLLINKLGFGTTVEGESARDFALALDKFVQNKCGQSTTLVRILTVQRRQDFRNVA